MPVPHYRLAEKILEYNLGYFVPNTQIFLKIVI